jgi:hypothetical protein
MSPAAPALEPAPVEIAREYRTRLAARRATLATADRHHLRFSQVRLGIVALAIVLLAWGGLDAALWLVVPAAAFAVTAVLHARLLNQRDRTRSAVGFYERCLARLEGRWAGAGRTGEAYAAPDHPYARDLDLVGRSSLFELVSSARTGTGEQTLAAWLLAPAPPDVIRSRQAAVAEFTPRLDLREAVHVMGDLVRKEVHASRLRDWARAPVALQGQTVRLALAALVATLLAVVGLLIFTGRFGLIVLTLLVVQSAIGVWFRTRVHTVLHAADEPSHDLDVLAGLVAILERQSFESPALRRLQADVAGVGRPASHEIARLSQWVALASSRENILFGPVAAALMWSTQWAFAIEDWRRRVGPHLLRWLDAVGELEALLSLSTLAYERPDCVFPDVVEGPARFEARGLVHPMLAPGGVRNDVALGGDGPSLLIVSGSNMSGKSTLLRTVGVSIVLAGAGGPVPAAACRLSPLAIGAAITIQDSLADGRSRFFAEIRRLKHVVDLAREREGHVIFLFDEIFGGTNSHDRRIGAEALLSGLVAAGAIGMATTHDLALAEIAGRLGPRAANVHFEDHFADGRLTFDYALRPGIVRSSNALALMRSIGLEV